MHLWQQPEQPFQIVEIHDFFGILRAKDILGARTNMIRLNLIADVSACAFARRRVISVVSTGFDLNEA